MKLIASDNIKNTSLNLSLNVYLKGPQLSPSFKNITILIHAGTRLDYYIPNDAFFNFFNKYFFNKKYYFSK